MPQVKINQEAPDFKLRNFDDQIVRLSDYKNEKNVLLVFNRGFI